MTESREVVTLREHLEDKLLAMDRRLADFREAQREAEKLLNTEMQRRLDNLNHEAARLLSAVAEMKANSPGKELYYADMKNINEKIESLQHTRANYEGRSSVYAFLIATLVSLGVSIVAAYLKV